MLATILATTLISVSVLAIAGDLRSVARDLGDSLTARARYILCDDRFWPSVAYSCLWLMIFGLSY